MARQTGTMGNVSLKGARTAVLGTEKFLIQIVSRLNSFCCTLSCLSEVPEVSNEYLKCRHKQLIRKIQLQLALKILHLKGDHTYVHLEDNINKTLKNNFILGN